MYETQDVPVLINFFNRPEPLRSVFAAVKEAKPRVLFLSQDGARENSESDKKTFKFAAKLFQI